MVAIGRFAEDLVNQVAEAIDDQMLVGVFERRVDAAKHLEHAQIVERAVRVPNRAEHLDGTISSGVVTLLGRHARSELPFQIAGVARGDEQIARANAEVQIAGCEFLEFQAEALSRLLRTHERELLSKWAPIACRNEFVWAYQNCIKRGALQPGANRRAAGDSSAEVLWRDLRRLLGAGEPVLDRMPSRVLKRRTTHDDPIDRRGFERVERRV